MTGRAFYLAITGGIGGAKLALGLSRVLAAEELVFVVNTGDDFEHLGFHISPDIDTLVYTLSGECNLDTGWGRRDESWRFMAALSSLGGETWFQLGDNDLAMHVQRTKLLNEGLSLSETTTRLARSLGVKNCILPMTNDTVRTVIETEDGRLSFQHYFVRDRCAPAVRAIEYDGATTARANPDMVAALVDKNLAGVILCPSNPFLSIDPLLSLAGVRDYLKSCQVPIIAVSPIVDGAAVKGPLAKMMRELSIPREACWVADHYSEFLDGFVLDCKDHEMEAGISARGIDMMVTNIVMQTMNDRVRLARECIDLITQLRKRLPSLSNNRSRAKARTGT